MSAAQLDFAVWESLYLPFYSPAHTPAYTFEELALLTFWRQATENTLYRAYLRLLKINPFDIRTMADIPFLPIQFFKNYILQTGEWQPEHVFESSGTSAMQHPSRHAVYALHAYHKTARLGFIHRYGDLSKYCFIGVLPSYLERTTASLVSMVKGFMDESRHQLNGFFLHDWAALDARVEQCIAANVPTIIIGVTFGLLNWAAASALPQLPPGIILMETGGMKGRREELPREEVHRLLQQRWGLTGVASEYGMTELSSQAYAPTGGRFYPSPTLHSCLREINDPFGKVGYGKIGALNCIDLGNLYTCAFIATDDLGKTHPDGSFEVMGRLDHAAIRGCNLLAL